VGITVRKSPIGSTNNQWGMNPPLIKVSLYKIRVVLSSSVKRKNTFPSENKVIIFAE